MSSLLPLRNSTRRHLGPQIHCHSLSIPSNPLSLHHWWTLEDVRRRSHWCFQIPRIWRRGSHVSLSRLLFHRLDTFTVFVPTGDNELQYQSKRSGSESIEFECTGIGFRFHHAHWIEQHWVEDVHG